MIKKYKVSITVFDEECESEIYRQQFDNIELHTIICAMNNYEGKRIEGKEITDPKKYGKKISV